MAVRVSDGPNKVQPGSIVNAPFLREGTNEEANGLPPPPLASGESGVLLALYTYTELRKVFVRGLREICFCCCLTFLPVPAWLLLNKTYKYMSKKVEG